MSHTRFSVDTRNDLGIDLNMTTPTTKDISDTVEALFDAHAEEVGDTYWEAEVETRGEYPDYDIRITLMGGGLTDEQFSVAKLLIRNALSKFGLRTDQIRVTSI